MDPLFPLRMNVIPFILTAKISGNSSYLKCKVLVALGMVVSYHWLKMKMKMILIKGINLKMK